MKEKIRPLRKSITLKMNLLIIGVVTAVSVVTYRKTAEVLLDNSIIQTQQLLANSIQKGETFLERINSDCSQFLYDTEVLEIIQRDNLVKEADPRDRLYVSEKLRTILLINSSLSAVAVYNGGYILHDKTRSEISDALEKSTQTIRSYAVQGKGKPVFFFLPSLENYIGMVRMVYNRDFTRESSLILAFFSTEELKRELTEGLREYNQYSGLYHVGLYMDLFTPDHHDELDIPSGLRRQMIEKTSYGSYTLRNSDELFSYRKFSGNPWTLYLRIPNRVIYEGVDSMKLTFLALGLLSIVISSFLGFIISANIAKPIHAMVEGIRKIEESPQVIDLKVGKNDEIGYLSRRFNSMTIKLDNLVNKVYREELLRKDVEIKALQARINPHFLFNTLESISWMARLQGSDDASNMITALSDILQVRMGRDSGTLIPLSEELKHLENYIYLQRFRFEENLCFSLHVEEEIRDCPVPSLILQPLVENAILHNNPGDKALEIIVSAEIRDDYLSLTVTDNGKGLDANELKWLREKVSRSRNNSGNGAQRGIGVTNAARRIFLIYGEDCSLDVKSRPFDETSFRIGIPLEKLMELDGYV